MKKEVAKQEVKAILKSDKFKSAYYQQSPKDKNNLQQRAISR